MTTTLAIETTFAPHALGARYDIDVQFISALDDPGDCLRCDTEGAEVEAQIYFSHDETGAEMSTHGCLPCAAKVIQRFANIDRPITVEVQA